MKARLAIAAVALAAGCKKAPPAASTEADSKPPPPVAADAVESTAMRTFTSSITMPTCPGVRTVIGDS